MIASEVDAGAAQQEAPVRVARTAGSTWPFKSKLQVRRHVTSVPRSPRTTPPTRNAIRTLRRSDYLAAETCVGVTLPREANCGRTP